MHKPNDYSISFSGLNEALEHVRKHGDPKGESRRNTKERNKFCGGATWSEMLELATNGWPEGYEAIRKASHAILDKVSSHIPVEETIYREVPVAGVIDMGRFMEGAPEVWIESEATEDVTVGPSTKAVRIVVNATTSAGISTHTIYTRGAAIVALAEALELCGRVVEIDALQAVEPEWGKGEDLSVSRICLKPFHARANWPLMSFAIAHPAMQRRLLFGIQETFSEDVRRRWGFIEGGCYGYPSNNFSDKGDLYLPCASYGERQWDNTDAAEKWILAELKKQGVRITA